MKNILLVSTGGTLASSQSGQGLTPMLDASGILSFVPEAGKICSITTVSLMSIDSSNMNPALMIKIAEAIAENYQKFDGFVITHGTDTLCYTSAALSYTLPNIGKPLILTGSQLPVGSPNTDAGKNIKDALVCACENLAGVYVVFSGKLILGTSAKKIKTKSLDAFYSINYPQIAQITEGTVVYNEEVDAIKPDGLQGDSFRDLVPKTNLCQEVMLLKIFPGMKSDIFDYIKMNYKGLVIEAYGLGGIPFLENNIQNKLEELCSSGIAVVITTQCLEEGVDLEVYEIGRKLSEMNIINGGAMNSEALVMKLMWALGNFETVDEVKSFMEMHLERFAHIRQYLPAGMLTSGSRKGSYKKPC